ncbi:MAG: hypothetical protein RIS88_701 [Pseudomonadota bacterium]|jgi:hypothetical protein
MLVARPAVLLALILGVQLVGKVTLPFETTRERRASKPLACEPLRVREQDFGYRRVRTARVRC